MTTKISMTNMDERQRLIWFMANRGTLIAVGAAWFGMIGWELTHGRVPTFLLIMVPVFAMFRAGLYFFYGSRPFTGASSVGKTGFVWYGKTVATLLLVIAAVLPIYHIEGLFGEETRSTYMWDLVRDDGAVVIPLALIYLWPILILILSRKKSQPIVSALVQYIEPFFAVLSVILVLWIPQLIFETRMIFLIILVPVNPVPAWGCYLAVAANGLYLVSWLAALLRPWGVQEL